MFCTVFTITVPLHRLHKTCHDCALNSRHYIQHVPTLHGEISCMQFYIIVRVLPH